MNFYLYLASLCLGIAAAAPQFDPTLDAKWEQWKSQHRRTYGAMEDNWRRSTWEDNLRMIEKHNLEYRAGNHSFWMEMNKFGDMTNEEFRQEMNGFKQKRFQGKIRGTLFHEPLLEQIPESVDWRKEGYVMPVKDQGQCASCWAFSATGSLEGQWFHKTGQLFLLSKQNLVDYSLNKGNIGCGGGFVTNAFEYVKKNGGIDTEESYPYEGTNGQCRYKPANSGAQVTRYVEIPSGEESALTNAVGTVGLISVAIDATHLSFQFYTSGVYFEPRCSSELVDHGMLVVGYGVNEESKQKYRIVKNSWGEVWGDNGYILMARDKNNHCEIASAASYPQV